MDEESRRAALERLVEAVNRRIIDPDNNVRGADLPEELPLVLGRAPRG